MPDEEKNKTNLVSMFLACLVFSGKPEIVSHEGPVDGQVRCVAEGYPAPRITWYYCEQPYIR